MKNLYTLSLLLTTAAAFSQAALPYTETFSYTPGSNLGGQGGWENLNTGDEIMVTKGSLGYPGLAASAGNKATFGGAGMDLHLQYAEQNSGTVYASFIMNVNDAGVTNPDGGYFAGFGESETNFVCTLWAKNSLNGFVLGINSTTAVADTQYTVAEYTLSTELFIVLAYDFATNTSSLWINPGSLGEGTAPAATLTATGMVDVASVDRFFLRQDSATETPNHMHVDEMRIGTSWADVTPTGAAGIDKHAVAGLKLFPNPLSGNILNITTTANASKTVAFYDVLGKQALNTAITGSTVNVSGLSAGVYIVKITEEGKTATRKLIIH